VVRALGPTSTACTCACVRATQLLNDKIQHKLAHKDDVRVWVCGGKRLCRSVGNTQRANQQIRIYKRNQALHTREAHAPHLRTSKHKPRQTIQGRQPIWSQKCHMPSGPVVARSASRSEGPWFKSRRGTVMDEEGGGRTGGGKGWTGKV
jgi:hypothetical protein